MSALEPDLFTIGHSNHPIAGFLELLRRHGIAAIADVRSRPYSRFVPHFSKERLRRLLREEGIGYLYLGQELGGKPPRGEVSAPASDYATRSDQPEFRAGIERLLDAARAAAGRHAVPRARSPRLPPPPPDLPLSRSRCAHRAYPA